jgi:hypothetical protein
MNAVDNEPPPLRKWDILEIWVSTLPDPHYKFCICICPIRYLFFFINSDPPYGRRARQVAVHISNFELQCITHDSYVNTTWLPSIAAEDVGNARASERHRRGSVPPSLRARICEAAKSHNVLTADQLAAVLEN